MLSTTRTLAALVLLAAPLPLIAQDDLAGRTVDYDDAWQTFYASGRTLYNAGRDSWGTWEMRDGRYCSQWPPASGWACYDLEIDGDTVRFTGDSGHVTVGTFR